MAEIRTAGRSDAPAIGILAERLAAEAAGLVVELPDVEDDGGIVLVASDGDAVVGFLAGRLVPGSVDEGRVATLDGFFVQPPQRGQGIAWDLIEAFEDWAVGQGAVHACTDVPIAAVLAQDYLQQVGFNVRGVLRVKVLDAGVDRYTSNDEEPWYSVRCHFALEDDAPFDYEERITLWRAESPEEAMALAEQEARQYAGSNQIRYLEACGSYRLADSGFAVNGKEVFSQMRSSDLDAEAYLDRFFFTGNENTTDSDAGDRFASSDD